MGTTSDDLHAPQHQTRPGWHWLHLQTAIEHPTKEIQSPTFHDTAPYTTVEHHPNSVQASKMIVGRWIDTDSHREPSLPSRARDHPLEHPPASARRHRATELINVEINVYITWLYTIKHLYILGVS